MDYKLYPATLDHLEAIIALDQLIFGAYGADESPDIIRARLTVFPQGCVVLVDEAREHSPAMVGFLTTEKWGALRTPALDEDPNKTHDPNGTVLNITTLAIAPQIQGQGCGALLVEQAIDVGRCQGCHEIILETARAKDFYLKHGFDLLEERLERDIPMAIMRLAI